MERRCLLTNCFTVAVAALVGGARAKPAGSALAPSEPCSSEIVIHKGWMFRRTDLCDGVRIVPFASDAE